MGWAQRANPRGLRSFNEDDFARRKMARFCAQLTKPEQLDAVLLGMSQDDRDAAAELMRPLCAFSMDAVTR